MLANKVILITGAFSGLGKAVTHLFMQSHAKVIGVGRNDQNKVPSYAANYLPIVRNLKTPRDAEEVVEFGLEKFRHIDMVLHCAGKGLFKPAYEMEKADFDRILNDNLYTAINLTQAVLPHFIDRKEGTLIFLPGVLGKTAMPGATAYCTAKFGLVGYAKALREDLKRTKIKVTTVYFGGVDSEFWADLDLKVQRDRLLNVQEAARALWFAVQQPDSGVMSELVLQPYSHQAI
jgi:NADP-dependent 3-hydroxy acid dehydrogenase YdfG